MKTPKPNSVEMLSAKAQIKREWDRADAKYLKRNPNAAAMAHEMVKEYEAELARLKEKKTEKDNADKQKSDKGYRK